MLVGTVMTGVIAGLDDRRSRAVLVVACAPGRDVQAVVLISYLTFRTALSPDAMLGRIGSTARTISVGLMPIGAFAGGALVDCGRRARPSP